MCIDLDAEFHVPKLLFEDFLPKLIRGAGNCESLIVRVKVLCLKYGGTHGIIKNHFKVMRYFFAKYTTYVALSFLHF